MEQKPIGWERRVGWLVQVLVAVFAVLSVRLPGNETLGEKLAQAIASQNGNTAPTEKVREVQQALAAFDHLLIAEGGINPQLGTGLAVASILALALLWVGRWWDGPTKMERLLTAAAPLALAAMLLVSPSLGLLLAAAQAAFELTYPIPREIFAIVSGPNGQPVAVRVQ